MENFFSLLKIPRPHVSIFNRFPRQHENTIGHLHIYYHEYTKFTPKNFAGALSSIPHGTIVTTNLELCKTFGGTDKVYYGRCANGKWWLKTVTVTVPSHYGSATYRLDPSTWLHPSTCVQHAYGVFKNPHSRDRFWKDVFSVIVSGYVCAVGQSGSKKSRRFPRETDRPADTTQRQWGNDQVIGFSGKE